MGTPNEFKIELLFVDELLLMLELLLLRLFRVAILTFPAPLFTIERDPFFWYEDKLNLWLKLEFIKFEEFIIIIIPKLETEF